MNNTVKFVLTNDDSHTLFSFAFNEHYHSVYGAVSESMHIFINAGFNYITKKNINILEIGFGTGLNAALTYKENMNHNKNIYYEAVELYPLDIEIIKELNYFNSSISINKIFKNIHNVSWNKQHKIGSSYILKKIKANLLDYDFTNKFDLVYFDAFAPERQPEMWTKEVFAKIFEAMNKNGILVTYSAKGTVKQALRSAGFNVKRLPGPKGKHHIIRAIVKNCR